MKKGALTLHLILLLEANEAHPLRGNMTQPIRVGRILLCALVIGTFFSLPAKADLSGSTLSWQYYAFGGAYKPASTFVDNGGVGGTFNDATYTYFNIIADGSSITFDYSVTTIATAWAPSALSLAPTIHDGIAIDMVTGPTFDTVTIDSATNMVGFDASRISFTGNEIQVDWQNLHFNKNTIVKLDVNAVPEPTSYLPFAGALAALVICKRKLERTVA